MLKTARIAAIVPVSDVEAAIHFYGDTLGLELLERRDDLAQNPEAEFRAADGTLLAYVSKGAGLEAGRRYDVEGLNRAAVLMRRHPHASPRG